MTLYSYPYKFKNICLSPIFFADINLEDVEMMSLRQWCGRSAEAKDYSQSGVVGYDIQYVGNSVSGIHL